jgi:hypothetical protein
MSRIDAYDLHQSLNAPLEQLKISDAITFCAKAWKEVTPETIRNCWLKTGILPNPDGAMEIEPIQDEYNELQNLINRLENVEASNKLSAEDFIKVEEEIQEFRDVEITDEEIISYVKSTPESEPEDELVAVEQKITTDDALKSLDTILSYIQNPPENLTFELKHINSIISVKSRISKHALASKKQSNLDRWFTTK